nr:hypothetical protein [Streptomyces sp. WMMB 322]
MTPPIGRLLVVDWAPNPGRETKCCTSSTAGT